ncbi:MAG: thioredoxin domain-containing protein [Phenylobacterium sp.]|uniref:DsbA family protein n=1 Tax=Phenylobacterium sp. TaxID=1871053 RepID=UPI001A4747F5|nr:DsbA family protein [Phenylobacterium sp.]MBL8772964.1 thioredoxin domain-containing protein [Phenylobacterium sp.]
MRDVLFDPGSPASGAARPDVTMVVFTDYQCGICKRTDGAIYRRLAEDGRLRVIWKDWPIRGPLSEHAARVALAAARQGRYDEIHAALMAARGTLTPERVDAIAVEAGCDPARLAEDLADPASGIDAQIGRHQLQAFGLGLQGTPAYLVGPYLIQGGLDDDALRRAVDRARRAGPPR